MLTIDLWKYKENTFKCWPLLTSVSVKKPDMDPRTQMFLALNQETRVSKNWWTDFCQQLDTSLMHSQSIKPLMILLSGKLGMEESDIDEDQV